LVVKDKKNDRYSVLLAMQLLYKTVISENAKSNKIEKR